MAANTSVLNNQLHWYKDAIIYELHIKAFADSNGDGIGDFAGLMQKLDYIQELGVTAIWLLPFYPSPLRDDGYDIADYYSINPAYGTLEDFQTLLNEAHKRNLKVITELVINHTSDQHPWFQRARHAPKGSPERDFYVWTDNPDQYKDVRIIFQDFEASNWTWDPVAQQYYWHRFFYHQPDLNYDNPIVQEEVIKVLDYWCDMGVDGFRLDAVPYLFEREGTNGENLAETHAFLKKLRKHMDEKHPGTLFLAEANMWPEDAAAYFGEGDECHMNYHFPVMPRMFMAVQMEDRYPITDIFDQTPSIPPTCQWAMFLRNHDELTLEMVTDEERDYMYKVYAKDPKARINLGIRHRLAPLMDNNRRKIELMNSLLFSLPGTPVIYYGDEIGMGDNFYLGDRDGVRTPMQWSADRNAGFSKANPQKLYLPVILDPEYHYEAVNVELQRSNTSSLFWYMKQIINIRKKYPVFGRGDLQFIEADNPKILAFTRTYENETLLVMVNLSKFAQPAELNLKAYGGFTPVDIFSNTAFPSIKKEENYFVTLSAHAFQWFMLQKTHHHIKADDVLPNLAISDWHSLFNSNNKQLLEEGMLLAYLRKTKWFVDRHRRVYSVTINNHQQVKLTTNTTVILLLEVQYETGLPEYYVLAVCFVKADEAKLLMQNHPDAVIATMKIAGEDGILCDAYYTAEMQQYFLQQLSHGETVMLSNGQQLIFSSNSRLNEFIQQTKELKPKLHFGNDYITAVTYNNSYFLRLYRKVDRGINPDVEIAKYLTGEAAFEHTPAYVGTIEMKTDKDVFTLGMMQAMVENHGHGENFMLERINNYIERILARDRNSIKMELKGGITAPVTYEELPEEMKILLGNAAAEQAAAIGEVTAAMHLSLANGKHIKEFKPEEFSLHYQRSLYSGMQTLTRETLQHLSKSLDKVQDKELAQYLINNKEVLLDKLKRMYAKKFDIVKVRTHGNYKLKKILLTGKGLSINDFSGNPKRSFSERRIKRSPLRDVVSMIRSFYYVAYEGFFLSRHIQKNEVQQLLPFAGLWAWYMMNFFLHAYYKKTHADSMFLPRDTKDLEILIDTYLVEKALQDLHDELLSRPEFAAVPMKIIKAVIDK